MSVCCKIPVYNWMLESFYNSTPSKFVYIDRSDCVFCI